MLGRRGKVFEWYNLELHLQTTENKQKYDLKQRTAISPLSDTDSVIDNQELSTTLTQYYQYDDYICGSRPIVWNSLPEDLREPGPTFSKLLRKS